MWVAGLGLGVRSQVREVSLALDSKWEDRAQFDVTLNTTSTDAELITSIGRLSIDGRIQTEGVEHNFNIIVEE